MAMVIQTEKQNSLVWSLPRNPQITTNHHDVPKFDPLLFKLIFLPDHFPFFSFYLLVNLCQPLSTYLLPRQSIREPRQPSQPRRPACQPLSIINMLVFVTLMSTFSETYVSSFCRIWHDSRFLIFCMTHQF